jgi:Terminase small subunit
MPSNDKPLKIERWYSLRGKPRFGVRCTAIVQKDLRQTGKARRCPNTAVVGTHVCKSHGGSAPQVKDKANRRLKAASITKDRVLLELARVAFSDVAGFFNVDNTIKKFSELNKDQRAVLAGFEAKIENVSAGDGRQDLVHKFKAWDKMKALEILAKHFGLMDVQVQHSGGMTIKWEE